MPIKVYFREKNGKSYSYRKETEKAQDFKQSRINTPKMKKMLVDKHDCTRNIFRIFSNTNEDKKFTI